MRDTLVVRVAFDVEVYKPQGSPRMGDRFDRLAACEVARRGVQDALVADGMFGERMTAELVENEGDQD